MRQGGESEMNQERVGRKEWKGKGARAENGMGRNGEKSGESTNHRRDGEKLRW